jgi:hypothetical protein
MKVTDISKQLKRKIKNHLLYDKSPKWLSSEEYANKYEGKWHIVYERTLNQRPPVKYFGKQKVNLEKRLDPEFPAIGVLELKNALIYNHAGWIFSEDGHLLPEHSWYGSNIKEMERIPRFLPKGKKISGVCLTLATDFSNTYGHFVLDSLPRIALFEQAGFNFNEVDHIVCPKPQNKNETLLFELSGIPLEKCIWSNDIDSLRIETLIAPTFPGTRRNYPKFIPDFMRNRFLKSTTSPYRKLYVTRSGYSRNPSNEGDIKELLVRSGFEIYDPIQNIDSLIDFSEASVVIGTSGSALTGLAFCQPGTKVLELMPSDHVYPYYYTLSDAAGLDYSCLVCRSEIDRGQEAWGPSPYDFFVDLDEFKQALSELNN